MRSGISRVFADRRYSAFDVSRNNYRMSAANFPKYLKALANVRTGAADAKILCVGDSTTLSQNTTFNSSWSTVLSALLDAGPLTPSKPGLCALVNSTTDTRFTLGAGWPGSTHNYGFAQQGWQWSNPSGNFVFADVRGAYDRYDVYYASGPAFGTFTATATGGSAVVTDCTVDQFKVKKVTISAASASTSNTLTISATGLGYLVGIEPYSSTVRTIRIGNAGAPSSYTGDWIAGTPWGGLNAIQAYAPDLTIICLMVNDAFNALALSTYLANITSIVNNAKVSGDVILMSMAPSLGTPYTTWEPLYNDGLRARSEPFIDMYTRAGTYAAWNALGFFLDDRHPSGTGRVEIGSFVHSVLTRI